jgi:hypothetical protein
MPKPKQKSKQKEVKSYSAPNVTVDLEDEEQKFKVLFEIDLLREDYHRIKKKLALASIQRNMAINNFTRACANVERENRALLIFAHQEKELRERELDRANALVDKFEDNLDEIIKRMKLLSGQNNQDETEIKEAFKEVLASLKERHTSARLRRNT